MKTIKFLVILFFLSFLSCEKPSECIESSGNVIIKDVIVTPFTKINVQSGIEIVLTQEAEYAVQIKTGENLIENIEAKVQDNTLFLKDNTTCNWVRDFGQTVVYISAPNIEEIYSKTEKSISSNGVLTYPTLRLFALDKNGDGISGAGTGDFFISVNNNQLVIENNNLSRYFISGATQQAIFNITNGDGRIDAHNLNAQNINIYHRGSNDLILNPIQSITGKILSTGNVILTNTPPVVNVQELYQGHLIYN